MKLSNLKSTKNIKVSKRLGRGESSGKGKTSGKGYKGQKSRGRGKVRLGFEGGQLPLIKRLPFQRGVGNNLAKKTITVTLSQLSVFGNGEKVNAETLAKAGLISKAQSFDRIKIVASGEVSKALIIEVDTTAAAAKQIEASKGKVIKKEKDSKDA